VIEVGINRKSASVSARKVKKGSVPTISCSQPTGRVKNSRLLRETGSLDLVGPSELLCRLLTFANWLLVSVKGTASRTNHTIVVILVFIACILACFATVHNVCGETLPVFIHLYVLCESRRGLRWRVLRCVLNHIKLLSLYSFVVRLPAFCVYWRPGNATACWNSQNGAFARLAVARRRLVIRRTTCGLGRGWNGSSCELCPPGFYGPGLNASGLASCLPCPAGCVRRADYILLLCVFSCERESDHSYSTYGDSYGLSSSACTGACR